MRFRRSSDKVLLMVAVIVCIVSMVNTATAVYLLLQDHENDVILANNRVELIAKTCVQIGATNLVILRVLEQRGVLDELSPLLAPVYTPGAVSDPLQARQACLRSARESVRPQP